MVCKEDTSLREHNPGGGGREDCQHIDNKKHTDKKYICAHVQD